MLIKICKKVCTSSQKFDIIVLEGGQIYETEDTTRKNKRW